MHRKADIIVAVTLMLVSAAAFCTARTEYGDGTEVAPMLYSAMLGLLSLILFLTSLMRRRLLSDDGKNADDGAFSGRFLAVVGAIAAYIGAISFIGFYVSTGVFLMLFMTVSKAASPAKSAAISLVLTVLLYAFFSAALKVPTPHGILL